MPFVFAESIKLMEEFRLSQGLLFLDALIAATSICNKLTLVTDNVKHFQFIKKLQLVPWKEVGT